MDCGLDKVTVLVSECLGLAMILYFHLENIPVLKRCVLKLLGMKCHVFAASFPKSQPNPRI